MNNNEYLLFKAVQWALNDIPNRTLTHPIYRNTYAIASAIDRLISSYEEDMNGSAVLDYPRGPNGDFYLDDDF